MVIMIVILLYQLIPTVSAKGFVDVPSNSTYLDGVNYVSDNGYMDGIGSSQFGLTNNMTRATFVQTLYAYAGKPSVNQTLPFTDIPSGAYYIPAVKWAYKNGIVSGTSSTTFSPNNSVKRQDAVLMFYKYANLKGWDISKTTSIAAYTDNSSVSNYALTAVKWAVAYGIISSTSSTSLVLSPHAATIRGAMAIMITKIGANVQKIGFTIDTYGFENTDSNFSSPYYLTSTHWNRLKTATNSICGTTTGSNVIAQMQNNKNEAWRGSCYGMCATVVLDKIGKIDANRNYSTSSTMHGISGSIRGYDIESAINYYHLSQYLPAIKDQRKVNSNLTIDNQFLSAYATVSNTNGIQILSFGYNNGGHACVVYKVTKNSSIKYTYEVYNPNYYYGKDTITFTKSNGTWNGVSSKTNAQYTAIYRIGIVSDFSTYAYGKADIDGYQNNDGSASNPKANSDNDNDMVFDSINTNVPSYDKMAQIEVELFDTEDFCIEDSNGQKLYWNGIELNGEIEEATYHFVDYSDRTVLLIDVPFSETYYLHFDSQSELKCSIADAKGYEYVDGFGISSVAFNTTNHSIAIIGDTMKYKAGMNIDSSEKVHTINDNSNKPVFVKWNEYENELDIKEYVDQMASNQ